MKKFGLQTLDILEQQPQRLLEVKSITEKRLNKIINSYNQSRGIAGYPLFFVPPSESRPKKAVKIYKAFGVRSMDVLKKAPFELCTLSGFGFKTVDAIARKTACRPNDPMRIRGALYYIMDEIRGAGHLYLPKEELRTQAYNLLNEGFPHEVVTLQAISAELYVMVITKHLLAQSGNIYRPKSLLAEEYTARKIAQLLLQPDEEVHIDKELMIAQKEMGFPLACNQLNAVKSSYSHKLTFVTGGPGTGKNHHSGGHPQRESAVGWRQGLAYGSDRTGSKTHGRKHRIRRSLHYTQCSRFEFGFGRSRRSSPPAAGRRPNHC